MSTLSIPYSSISFTTHACRRLSRRTTLNETDVLFMLHNNFYINLGRDCIFDRTYLMFYSIKDKQCYVVVINEHTGFIVTFLNIRTKYRWLNRRVTDIDLHNAKTLICNSPVIYKDTSSTAIYKNFIIKYSIITEERGIQHKPLCKLPSDLYQGSVETFLASVNIIDVVNTEFSKQDINTRNVDFISIRVGSKKSDNITFIDYPQSIRF